MLQQGWSPCYMQVSISYSCYNKAGHPVICKYRYLTHVTTRQVTLLYASIDILLMLQQRWPPCYI
jgi:hypothetical protein